MATALKKNETPAIQPTNDASEKELDPRVVREKAGLSVEKMASLMAMSEFGYSAWESGHRRPGGPAYQLLRLLDDDPKTVAIALSP